MKHINFGQKLKELRQKRGYTQEVLAEMINIDEKHLSRIENGKYFPKYTTLINILKVLNVSMSDFEVDNKNTNCNTYFLKSMQILNSTQNEKILKIYYETLKHVQKMINNFSDKE